ncbi:MAG: PKD domain-containing protein [Candidatus Gracilibacteria bacterium]|nr:PKD domain-containing protein [Candidatus Gracilibacteria bacterium]
MELPKKNNDNQENDILGNLSQNNADIEANKKEIDNSDLISMFDLPEKIEEKINENNIYDINIVSLNDILLLLEEKKYDFVTFEPNENSVKVEFRKNNVIVDTKQIKYPTYSNILLKAKGATKLNLEDNNSNQEGNGGISFDEKNFQLITKVVPSNFGEKLFIKSRLVAKLATKKDTKKMSTGQILSFMLILSIILLIVGGSFLGFIVLNAKTVDDVKFFAGLGINLNEINAFIAKLITIIFSIIVLSETILLIIFLFKFFLTKKEFKKKKIKFAILSVILLIITFITATAWMVVDQKIKNLPNWQEMSFGEIQIYDNSKLVNENFSKESALISDTSNLIGPIELKFDLTYLAQAEEKKGIKIKNFTWDFGNDNVEETVLPNLIKTFDKIGTTDIKLTINGIDSLGKEIQKTVETMPYINITYVVGIKEKKLNSGGKLVTFDAKSLEQLGKIEWYTMDDLKEPVWQGSEFINGKPIFEDTIFGMYIKKSTSNENDTFDKLFIIKGEDKVNIDGEIGFERGLVNDLEVTLSVKNLANDIGAGYIEKYIWTVGEQVYTKIGDIENSEKASEVKHKFVNYGEQTVKVEMINSAGESKTITKTIQLPKVLKLSDGLKIFADGTEIKDVSYNPTLNEYFLNEVGYPSQIKLDGRFIKADSTLYNLSKIEWDYDSDGNIDFTGKTGNYELNKEGNIVITAKHYFVNRKVDTDIVAIEEKIYIEAIKKDAIITFDIIADSEYAPVIIKLDGSKSQVKDSNIAKFIWDYGDGIKEERDAIVPGRRYTEAGDYDIKLTVVTSDGKSYSTSKKLILKPTPQSAKIEVSMKKAPTLQGIDFTSNKSEGQIASYFWNFGDGTTSTEANPTHTYGKPGIYKVTLKLDFTNKNILEDNLDIEIY